MVWFCFLSLGYIDARVIKDLEDLLSCISLIHTNYSPRRLCTSRKEQSLINRRPTSQCNTPSPILQEGCLILSISPSLFGVGDTSYLQALLLLIGCFRRLQEYFRLDAVSKVPGSHLCFYYESYCFKQCEDVVEG